MWATVAAIVVLALLGAVGSLRLYKERRLWLDARTGAGREAMGRERRDQERVPERETGRPKIWAVMLASVIVFGLAAAAVGLLVDTIARSSHP